MKRCFINALAVLLCAIVPGLAFAQAAPPPIIIKFGSLSSIPLGWTPLLAALGIVLIVLIAGRRGKLRNATLFVAAATSFVLAGMGLFGIDAVRAQVQRTLELITSPAMLQVTAGQNESVLVQNKTGQPVVLLSITIGDSSANEYSIASSAETTCKAGLKLDKEETCEIRVIYTAGGGGGGDDGSGGGGGDDGSGGGGDDGSGGGGDDGGSSDFINNPKTPDDFIQRAEALANGDPRITPSTPEELQEAFKADQTPEVIAHKNRLRLNHDLVLAAVDPDPAWHSTEASSSFIVAETGGHYAVDLRKIDPDGNDLGALSKTDQAKLKFELRVQEDEKTINYIPSKDHKDYIGWDETTSGRLLINVPANMKQGRLLIGVRPKFKDKGQTAIAERWSVPVIVNIWPKRTGVTAINTSNIYYPTQFSEGVQPRSGSAFDMIEITTQLEQAYADFPGEPILKPLVIAGANLSVGQLIDVRISRPGAGVYPYGGRVLRVTNGDGGQQLAILNFDLASVYEVLTSDPMVSEGVMPEFVTYRVGAEQQVPTEGGDPELEYFGPEERSGIKRAVSDAPSNEKVQLGTKVKIIPKCTGTVSTSFVYTPILEFSPNFNIGVEYTASIGGVKGECVVTLDGSVDIGDKLAKNPIVKALKELIGLEIKAGPYGEFKLSLESNGGIAPFFEITNRATYIEGLSSSRISSSGLSTGGDLYAEPSELKTTLGGAVGLVANAEAKPLSVFGGKFQAAGLEGKAEINMGFVLDNLNAAAVKQSGKASQASENIQSQATLTVSTGFVDMMRFLGFKSEAVFGRGSTPLKSFVMDATYPVKEVQDNGNGTGSVSFYPPSRDSAYMNSPLLNFSGSIAGYAALDGSSVYNDPTNNITYEQSECEERGGVISTPLIVCTGGSFCGKADRNAEFCKTAWVTPVMASAYVGETATTTGTVGTNSKTPIYVGVVGSPLVPTEQAFHFTGAGSQTFTAKAACTTIGVTRGSIQAWVGGSEAWASKQDDILVCNCKPGDKDCDRIWGDPYMITADGMAYTYLATGNYILARVHDADEQPIHGFEVQANFLPGFGAAWLYSTAMQVGDDVVEFRPAILGHNPFSVGLEVMVNGNYLYAPAQNGTGGSWPGTSLRLVQLPGGGLLYVDAFVQQYFTYKPRRLTVIWPQDGPFDGYAVNVSMLDGQFTNPEPFMELQFTRPEKYAGHERGLLGNNDGNPKNDFIRRNGQMLGQDTPLSSTGLYALFGGDWLAKPSECLFAAGCSTDPEFASQPVELTPEQRAFGEFACAGLTGFYRQACINDVGLTGSTDLVKGYYANTEDLNYMAGRIVTPGVDVPMYLLFAGERTGLPGYDAAGEKMGFRQAYQVMLQSGEGPFLLTIRPPRGASAFFSEGSPGALTQSFTATGSKNVSVDVQCGNPDPNWSLLGDLWASAGAVQLWAVDPLSGFASRLLGEKRLSCFSQRGRIAAGGSHTIFVDEEGQVWAWGVNGYGELGDGSSTGRSSPIQVNLTPLNGSKIVSVVAGYNHSLALDDRGRVLAWGYNYYGQLGDGSSLTRLSPVLANLSPLNGSMVVTVAAGESHSLAFDDQGRLWAWGSNSYGQLGDGSTTNRSSPVQVNLTSLNDSKAVSVAAGSSHSLALDDQGRLWAWGANSYGQLGDGSSMGRSSPVLVNLSPLNGSTVVAVAAGAFYSLALDDQGRLWAWGYNVSGQLGDGSTTNRSSPVQVDLTPLNGSKVVAISAGASHSLALDDQGRLWAWGYNYYGQLGDGSSTTRFSPVQVDLSPLNGSMVVAVSAGSQHSLALDGQGRLWTWGYNPNGQLGDGSTTNRSSPVQVMGIQLSVGERINSIPEDEGKGFRQAYQVHQFGNGQLLLTIRPPRGASAFFSAGSVGALAQKLTFTGNMNVSVDVQCDNPDPNWAQEGDAWLFAGAVQLWAVDTLSGVASQLLDEKRLVCFQQKTNNRIAAGAGHTIFVDDENQVWAWGYNGYGQLGDSSTTSRSGPVQVNLTPLNGSKAVAVAAGENHSLELDDQGRLWAWGYNNFGQLGNGSTTNRSSPVQVDLAPLNGSKAVVVAAGASHSLALDDQSRVWAWGANSYGQLGDGSTTSRNRPARVNLAPLNGSTVMAIAVGQYHSLALDDQGRLWAWGTNSYGQLGDGSTTGKSNPVLVNLSPLNGSTVVAVAAGENHSLALDDQGRLWAWGYNGYGQLGNGSTTNRSNPVQVDLTPLNGSKIVAIAVGANHSLVLDDQGRLWAWGTNAYGQLGDDTTTNRPSPVQVNLAPLNGSKIVAVAAGGAHSLALDDQGRLWAWGYSLNGQLGDGSTANRLAPVEVRSAFLFFGERASLPGYSGHDFRQAYQVASLSDEQQLLLTIRPPRGASAFLSEGNAGALTQKLTFTGNTKTSVDVQCGNPDPDWELQGDAWPLLGAVQLWAVDPLSGDASRLLDEKWLSCFSPQATYNRITVRSYRSLFVDDGGQAWTWGSNASGVSGDDGGTTPRPSPVSVDLTPLNGDQIVTVAAGYSHFLAIDNQGHLWGWGSNVSGQLGDSFASRTSPALVNLASLNGSKVVAIAAGGAHSLALDDFGRLWAWGDNGYGQLGDGSFASRTSPVLVDLTPLNGSNVATVAAGYSHSLAIDDQGRLWAWGTNSYGQLGDGSTTYRPSPVLVNLSPLNGSKVVTVAGGYDHSLAIDDQGRVWAWGYNVSGQLGDGSTTNRSSPVQVDLTPLSGSTVVAVAAGASHSLALDDQNRLWAWGSGPLGNDNATSSLRPVQVDLSPLKGSVVVAVVAGYAHSLVLDDLGRLWAWGGNAYGQLGDGSNTNQLKPVLVMGERLSDAGRTDLPGYSAGGAGKGFRQAYQVIGFGVKGRFLLTIRPPRGASAFFSEGSLGALTQSLAATGNANVSVDVQCDTPDPNWAIQGDAWPLAGAAQLWAVDPLSGAASQLLDEKRLACLSLLKTSNGIAAGTFHTLYSNGEGHVWAWGSNYGGALGDGSSTNRLSPVPVDLTSLNGSKVVAVSAGYGSSLALDDQGTLWAWGSNSSGQLGDGSRADRTKPVAVDLAPLNGSVVVAVSTRSFLSLALDDQSRLWAWGANFYGQLGDGSTTSRNRPVPVDLVPLNGSTVVAVSAGGSHSLARDDQGRLWAWGANNYGQLGDGSTTNRSSPVLVDLVPLNGSAVVTVLAGEDHSLAIDDQGRLWAWGYNGYGQLGDGSTINRSSPVLVNLSPLNGSKVVAVAAGSQHSLALDDQGRLWAWGYNYYGQLGNGTTTARSVPVPVDLAPLNGSVAVAVVAGARHSLARDDQGRLWAWGANDDGRLGDGSGSTNMYRTRPVQVNMSMMNGD